jgi:hypothetical protein
MCAAQRRRGEPSVETVSNGGAVVCLSDGALCRGHSRGAAQILLNAFACSSYPSLTVSKSEPIPYSCPSCEARYRIVTVLVPADTQDDLKCSALFPPTEGASVRYFLVGRPRPPYILHKRGRESDE